jgi:hypothetical protein
LGEEPSREAAATGRDIHEEPVDEAEIRRADALLNAFLQDVERREAVIHGRTATSRMDPRGGWLPGEELAEGRDPARRPKLAYRQVGVKLSWSQYRELRHAAELYGVTPTTLARMLINRGARSILESDRRDAVRFAREAGR